MSESPSSSKSKITISLKIGHNQFLGEDDENHSKDNVCKFKKSLHLNKGDLKQIQKVVVTNLYPHGGAPYDQQEFPSRPKRPKFIDLAKRMSAMFSESNHNLIRASLCSMESFQQGLVN